MNQKIEELNAKIKQQNRQVACETLDDYQICVDSIDTSSDEKARETGPKAISCILSELEEALNITQGNVELSLSADEKIETDEAVSSLSNCTSQLMTEENRKNPAKTINLLEGCLARYTSTIKSVLKCK